MAEEVTLKPIIECIRGLSRTLTVDESVSQVDYSKNPNTKETVKVIFNGAYCLAPGMIFLDECVTVKDAIIASGESCSAARRKRGLCKPQQPTEIATGTAQAVVQETIVDPDPASSYIPVSIPSTSLASLSLSEGSSTTSISSMVSSNTEQESTMSTLPTTVVASNNTSNMVVSSTSTTAQESTSLSPTTSDEVSTSTSDVVSSTTEFSSTVPSSATSLLTELTTQTNGTTSAPTTMQTSTVSDSTTPMCVVHAGPSVPTAYCDCSTSTEDQTFYATATPVSGQCFQYTQFPSDITLAPTTTAASVSTTAPPVPLIETESGGVVVSYSSQTVEYGKVGGVQITMTNGLGTPVTISTPVPTQTAGNNDGAGSCTNMDDACDRAYSKYEDDVVYTDYTAYTASVQSGILMVATFGTAGCTAMFECDDYGIGMTGAEIKNA